MIANLKEIIHGWRISTALSFIEKIRYFLIPQRLTIMTSYRIYVIGKKIGNKV